MTKWQKPPTGPQNPHLYQKHILGKFTKPDPIVLVIAGTAKEYDFWRRRQAPMGIKTKYICDPHEIRGYHDPDVVFVGTWRKRKDCGKILEELRHQRMSKTKFWHDGDAFCDGTILFPLGQCFFPTMRKEPAYQPLKMHSQTVQAKTRKLRAKWKVQAQPDLISPDIWER